MFPGKAAIIDNVLGPYTFSETGVRGKNLAGWETYTLKNLNAMQKQLKLQGSLPGYDQSTYNPVRAWDIRSPQNSLQRFTKRFPRGFIKDLGPLEDVPDFILDFRFF